ncbi:peptidylprolyl isomerase, partial [Shimia sp.]|uniref:peptidylprolyl isomerase n=1 Tax=Shimia sp. TaxID=1954381 RepID=UPI0035671FFD
MTAFRVLSRLIGTATLCLGLGLATTSAARAQSAFSPAILVNDQAVTYFEIEQRALLLTLMNAPGDLRRLAREQLIDERLQNAAAELLGVRPSEDSVQAGIARFSERANQPPEQLIEALKAEGVAEETLRDFVYSGIAWSSLIQARYGGKVQISEAEIDRAIASNTGAGGINVLLSEIVIPVSDQTRGQVAAIAHQLAAITSPEDFEAAARKYSKAATAADGGRLKWLSITKLPAELRPAIMALNKGEVTAPVPLPNAIALFQMRGKAEAATPAPRYSAIDYAVLTLPGGRAAETLQLAERIRGRIDTCDDLYGEARAFPEDYLQRQSVAPGKLPRDLALELARL